MMKRLLAAVATLAGLAWGTATSAYAQAAPAKPPSITKTLKDTSNNKLPYQLFLPDNFDQTKSYPLLMDLHGGGGLKMAPYTVSLSATQKLLEPEMRSKYPAFIFVPQTSTGWFDNPPEVRVQVLEGRYRLADHEEHGVSKLVLQALADIMKEYPIDPARLYVTGQSGGAVYTWELLMRHPGMFAAAVPISGPGDVTMVDKIDCPVWCFHGDKDGIAPVKRSREMVAAMEAAGCEVKYTELPGVGHEAWKPAWQDPELVAWVFAQKRTQK